MYKQIKSPKSKKNPSCSLKIRGIFYKKDENKENVFHFILPNIYHNDDIKTNTINQLMDYDKKVEKYFHGNDEKKLDEIIVENNVQSLKICKPIYRENKLIFAHNLDKNTSFTSFKTKSNKKLDLIVGLEYLMDVNCYAGNFTNTDSRENITYWNININDITEVTKID